MDTTTNMMENLSMSIIIWGYLRGDDELDASAVN